MTGFTTDNLRHAKIMLSRARQGGYSIRNWRNLELASERQYRLCAKDISDRLTRRPETRKPEQLDIPPEQVLRELRTANHELGCLESIMYGSKFYNLAYPADSIPRNMLFPGQLDASPADAETTLAARIHEAMPIGVNMANIILVIDKAPVKEGSVQQKTILQAAKRIREILEDPQQGITGDQVVSLIDDMVFNLIDMRIGDPTRNGIIAGVKNGLAP